jgi:hypothetical protein
MVLLGVAALVLLAIVVGVFLAGEPDADRRAAFVRRLGFLFGALTSALVGLFVVGEAMADPGGWEGVGLIVSWVGPVGVASALAWWWPRVAVPLAVVAVVAVVALSAWFALAPEAWRSVENERGPVRAIATFAVGAVLVVLGRRRTALAGGLLVVPGLVPVVLAGTASDGLASLTAASAVPVLTGSCYLVSAALAPRTARTAIT